LPGGADLMVLAVDATGPGAPVQLLVSTGDADSDFVISDKDAGAAGAPISASGVTLAAASYYTVLAAGDLGTPNLFPILAQDDRRSIATEARVRAIHAASTAGTVDVFVTPTGDVTVASIELGEVTPDPKSTRLNSSHVKISYAVFCLKKKK